MLKLLQNVGYVLIFFTAGLTSCVNLKHVNDFSSTSLNSLKKFEEINYSFKQNCFDNCQNIKIQNLNLNSDECDCASNVKADSITLIIYSSLRGYLDGLTKLSKNDVTNYKMDAFTTALTEGNFGAITVQKGGIKHIV